MLCGFAAVDIRIKINILWIIMENKLLPNCILQKSIISEGGAIAWNKNSVIEAIEEIVKLNYAILGGDVWALRINNIPNSKDSINYEDIYVGIIPFKNGSDTVCNWHSSKNKNEKWSKFVLRSKKETLKFIFNEPTIENLVEEKIKDKIYYNLVYSSEYKYNLIKKLSVTNNTNEIREIWKELNKDEV